MDSIEEKVNAFVSQWYCYEYPDKFDKIQNAQNKLIEQIDRCLEKTNQGNKKEKAKLFYLKGKLLNLLTQYDKLAEDYLNKSIKLNPTNGDCWNTLADVLYKKKDYQGAHKSIEMALENKGKNKVSLQYQSVLLRTQCKVLQEQLRNSQESLCVIKQALLFDMQDAITWYFLGNAYLNNFMAAHNKIEDFHHAIKAFNQAQKYFKYPYPDLFFNRASAYAYVEKYTEALENFKKAEEIDPTLNSKKQIQLIHERVQYTKTLFSRTSQLKKNKIQQLVKTIPNSIKNDDKAKIVSIKTLMEGCNSQVFICLKIMNKITNQKQTPASFIVLDTECIFLAVSIYKADESLLQLLKKDVILTIKDPHSTTVKVDNWQYPCIQVFYLHNLWIDGAKVITRNQQPIDTKAFRKK